MCWACSMHVCMIRILNSSREMTWVLNKSMINKLTIFERKIMRKILGPTRSDNGYWRIKTNQEINDTLKGQNIIGFIKKQRLNWLGHVERMTEDNNVKKISTLRMGSFKLFKRPFPGFLTILTLQTLN